ncbi:hypothetical protein [Paenibacillus alkalitolerans]|uniref:hypothetical protein n=1 Tax=Paenibacillus alkalitolerans TaxID=2799335 RepID=UPI0018F5DAEC|nr:hypothetical protein [Paenibacillus alkalitolerans]
MRKLFPEYQICISGLIDDLPESWTETLVRGVDKAGQDSANTLAAVNISIRPEYQKMGLSRKLLEVLPFWRSGNIYNSVSFCGAYAP